MFIPGLVSITFRKLSPREIIDLVVKAGFKGIEWGGDVHVPHGDVQQATEVRKLTEDAGLQVTSYGSYYRLQGDPEKNPPFEDVLASAVELKAPTIRIWAGRKASKEADDAYRQAAIEETRALADAAKKENITISFEYHSHTLTDTNESAQRLLKEIDHPNVLTFWQPPNGQEFDYCHEGLKAILPVLTHIHCFHWWPTAGDRRPLAEGSNRWLSYLQSAQTTGRDHAVLMEFVKGDDPAQFLEDAATLTDWLKQTTNP